MIESTGPEELRRVIGTFKNEFPQLTKRGLGLIDGWDADRAAIARLAGATTALLARAERAEAALERARALLVELRDADIVALGPSGWADLKRRVNAAALAPDGAR